MHSIKRHNLILFSLLAGVVPALLTPASATASYPITLPWRGDALDPGVYFRSRGHTDSDYGNATWAIDFHAATWTGSSWATNDGGGQNVNDYIFGADICSPVDAAVVTAHELLAGCSVTVEPGVEECLVRRVVHVRRPHCTLVVHPCPAKIGTAPHSCVA